MPLIGIGLYLANSTPSDEANAPPSIGTVTLNFDLVVVNEAPVGSSQAMLFDVQRANVAPSISDITLNFDLTNNIPPSGTSQAMLFDVRAA